MNRRHRLSGRRAFADVRARRTSAVAGSLRVAVGPNRVGAMRLGMAVPRAAGGAVVRNRIRRRLRALLAERAVQLVGLDVVVSAGAGAASVSASVLRADLDAALRRSRSRARLAG